jgi:hypothetical protein
MPCAVFGFVSLQPLTASCILTFMNFGLFRVTNPDTLLKTMTWVKKKKTETSMLRILKRREEKDMT